MARRRKQWMSTRDALVCMIVCIAVGLFCCLFLRWADLPRPEEQGISGQAAYHSSSRLYSGKHNHTFSGLRLEFPDREPLFLHEGFSEQDAALVEALEPGTRLYYLCAPDSGGLMALKTEDRVLLSYENYAECASERAEVSLWFGTFFLGIGTLFLIPVSRNLWVRRHVSKKKSNRSQR